MRLLKKSVKEFYYRFRPLPDFYGRDFKTIFALLKASGQWDPERIKEYKLHRLRALLKHAGKNVPYYRELFQQKGIRPEDFNKPEDLRAIPILTKSIVRANLDRLQADDFSSYRPIKTETSGTSGQITTLFRSSYQESFRKAVMWRFYHQQGLRFGDRILTMTSPGACDPESPIYEHDQLQNRIIINTFHLTSGHCDKVVPVILKYKPKMIWAHPNMLCVLSEYLLDSKIAPLEVPLIATYGEKIYPHVRMILTRAFKARFVEYFGNRENSIAAWGNSDDCFYEISEYCHLEVEKEKPSGGPGAGGILLSTSLHNYAVPLIRYDSEDIAEYLDYATPAIPYPAIRLWGGRGKDLLLSSDGLVVPYTPHYFESSATNRIKKYQIEQISLNELILRVVPQAEYRREIDESELLKYFNQTLAGKFKIRVDYVEEIPFTRGGKYPVAISPLAVKYLSGKA